jgi:hypothetical protein
MLLFPVIHVSFIYSPLGLGESCERSGRRKNEFSPGKSGRTSGRKLVHLWGEDILSRRRSCTQRAKGVFWRGGVYGVVRA